MFQNGQWINKDMHCNCRKVKDFIKNPRQIFHSSVCRPKRYPSHLAGGISMSEDYRHPSRCWASFGRNTSKISSPAWKTDKSRARCSGCKNWTKILSTKNGQNYFFYPANRFKFIQQIDHGFKWPKWGWFFDNSSPWHWVHCGFQPKGSLKSSFQRASVGLATGRMLCQLCNSFYLLRCQVIKLNMLHILHQCWK